MKLHLLRNCSSKYRTLENNLLVLLSQRSCLFPHQKTPTAQCYSVFGNWHISVYAVYALIVLMKTQSHSNLYRKGKKEQYMWQTFTGVKTWLKAPLSGKTETASSHHSLIKTPFHKKYFSCEPILLNMVFLRLNSFLKKLLFMNYCKWQV